MNGHGGKVSAVVVTLTDHSGEVVATATTDENGEYRFRGISEGTYTVTAYSRQGDPVAHAVTVSSGIAPIHYFGLGDGCELTGSVRRSDVQRSSVTRRMTSPWRSKGSEQTAYQPVYGAAGDSEAGHPDDEADDPEVLEGDDDVPGDDDQPPPRRTRVRVASVTAVVAVLMVSTGWVGWTNGWLGLGGTAEASNPSTVGQPAATAEVSRQTLTETKEVGGTLGHGDPLTLTAATPGTITGIAESDTDLERGMELYRLNERPATAMFGSVPMYRDLQFGATGADVRQLERNLDKLGYDGFTVDDEFTGATADAVRRWQDDLGLPETGTVARSDLVFVPKGGRIDSVHTDVGGAVGQATPVLDITGSEQVVSLEAEIEDREQLAVDTEVSVRLPGGDEAGGVVTEANLASAGSGSGEESAGGGEDAAASEDPVVEVEVSLDEAVDESLLGAPVDVVADVDNREDVLTVPVNALLALAGGGHGLEVVAEDGTTSLVPVETGLYAQGRVEVEGDGIEEGTVVGVAGR